MPLMPPFTSPLAWGQGLVLQAWLVQEEWLAMAAEVQGLALGTCLDHGEQAQLVVAQGVEAAVALGLQCAAQAATTETPPSHRAVQLAAAAF